MTLQDAIEYIRKVTPDDGRWTMWDIAGDEEPSHADKAIATILNAVVKGELRAEEKQDPYWKTY